ncbi:integrase [Cryobacterium arcticum]|uniref:Integrase n=1 Tax=Cryobacterium arcticum TaxID=670052 RepID=A0A1B1BM15_9MICO|nr:integrase [Cryobacterium arcticum]
MSSPPFRSAAVGSVGFTGDSHDNAMAEAFNSISNAEFIRNGGSWRGIDDFGTGLTEPHKPGA